MYGFILLLLFSYLIYGLVKPEGAIPATWQPSRWKVFGLFVLGIILVGPLEENELLGAPARFAGEGAATSREVPYDSATAARELISITTALDSLGRVRKRGSQKPPDAGQLDHRQERRGRFVEPRRQAPMLFEPPDQPFDRVPPRVLIPLKHRRTPTAAPLLPGSQLPLWDDSPDPTLAQPGPDPLGVVPAVGEQPLRTARGLDERADGLELRRLALLAGREMDCQRQPVPIADNVELGAQPAPASPERLAFGRGVGVPLFRAPEATREARIVVPSIIHVE